MLAGQCPVHLSLRSSNVRRALTNVKACENGFPLDLTTLEGQK